MNRLLLLSCSQSKRTVPNLIPAIERYDGPAFRVVRRYLRDSVAKPRIYILSGEFGLIRHNESIPYYDRRMTPERALELGPIVATKLYMLIESEVDKHWETFICMSKSYLNALNASDSVLKTASRITVAEGSPGKKLTELYAWLYGEASTSLYKEP
ncbi:MAG TPA: hypothetical protein VLR90_07275, partial [Blastocatellia bacterium]|nr:hypothetical protein [Blastocatellia bacterium]